MRIHAHFSLFFGNSIEKTNQKGAHQKTSVVMSSLAQILRKACAANNLGVSGSSTVMFKRLVNAGKNKVAPARPSITKAKINNVAKKKKSAFTTIDAATYFYEVCKGKISMCRPHIVQEPSGRRMLKEIKMVQGANGKYPRWVLVKE